MVSHGTVRVWHEEAGWGVLDSDDTPGGCWAHFSALRMDGYKVVRRGQELAFQHEQAEQDGYAYRATAIWREGEPMVEDSAIEVPGMMTSVLSLDFDHDPDGDQDRDLGPPPA